MIILLARRIAAASVLLTAGCHDTGILGGDVVCTAEARSSFSISAVDALSGAPVAEGASLILRDGSYVDSTVTVNPWAPPYSGHLHHSTYERAGTYTVRVRREGYATWERTGVTVTQDRCHVRTVEITAQLQPLP